MDESSDSEVTKLVVKIKSHLAALSYINKFIPLLILNPKTQRIALILCLPGIISSKNPGN